MKSAEEVFKEIMLRRIVDPATAAEARPKRLQITHDDVFIEFEDGQWLLAMAHRDGDEGAAITLRGNVQPWGLQHAGLMSQLEVDEYAAQSKAKHEEQSKERDYRDYLRLKARFEPSTEEKPQ